MKDAFGGSYMIYIFIGFIIIFTLFISLILQYAQAFKVKDNIISLIEEYDSYNLASDEIDNYLESSAYRINSTNIKSMTDDSEAVCDNTYGYCYSEHSKDDYKYYTVYTFVNWSFPFFKLNGTWMIKGETRIVYG